MADPKREPYRPERKPSTKPPEPRSWLRKWAYETSKDGLAIDEDRWLDMTPRQVQELEIIHLHQMQREDYHIGIIAAQVENYSMCHPKEAAHPRQFMLHPFDPQAEQDDEAMAVGDKIAAYYSRFPSQGDAGPAPPPEARVPVILGPIPETHLLKESYVS